MIAIDVASKWHWSDWCFEVSLRTLLMVATVKARNFFLTDTNVIHSVSERVGRSMEDQSNYISCSDVSCDVLSQPPHVSSGAAARTHTSCI